jgi:hypothetical protein
MPATFMRPTFEQKIIQCISNPFNKNWQPQWVDIDGNAFVKLDQFDEAFYKYCTGQCIRWGTRDRKEQNHYFPFWDDLVKLRNRLSQEAFERVLTEMRDVAPTDDGPRKKQKVRKAKMSDQSLAGRVVEGVMKFGDHTQAVKMTFGVRGADLYVNMDVDVLAFIQHGMHQNFVAEHLRPPAKSPGPAKLRATSKSKAAKQERKLDDETNDDDDYAHDAAANEGTIDPDTGAGPSRPKN